MRWRGYPCRAMPIDLQPTLEGELITLRPLRADDWDGLFAVASDPLIWAQHPARDRHQREVFERFFREALEEAKTGTGGAFTVIDRSTGTIIGSTRYHGFDADRSELEIGWTFLARSYWGGRYNGEMKRLLLNHAFTFARRAIFLVGVDNIRSQTAMERIGGVRSGFVDKVNVSGTLVRSIRYVIERPG